MHPEIHIHTSTRFMHAILASKKPNAHALLAYFT